MPNYVEYQKSISNELLSIKDRVRNFIDDHHWGEDGRYKEIILSHIVRQHLPNGVSVGTGFVSNADRITKQVDIIMYRDDCPLLFKQDDFVIAPAECVLGIIEVKSRITTRAASDVIQKATYNGEVIGKRIFNGVFAFESEIDTYERRRGVEVLAGALQESAGTVNNICLGKNIFIKYWNAGMPTHNPRQELNYAFYRINNLSSGYFISNLVEDVYISTHGRGIPETLENMFYPIENTKEAYRAKTIEIEKEKAHDEF